MSKPHEVYRLSTIGQTLQDTLETMMADRKINLALHSRVLNEFDRVVGAALEQKVRNRLIIKCNRLRTYRYCDTIWTLLLKDVEFREVQELIRVDWVKIVAFESRR